MTADRRHALLEIARRHNVLIIEDDVYRPLLDDRPPTFASLEPDLTVHVTGLSKCVAPGLRLGFVVAPRALIGDIAAMLRINCWSIAPLGALVGARMIEDGTIQRIVEEQKEELRARQALLRECLAGFNFHTGDDVHARLARAARALARQCVRPAGPPESASACWPATRSRSAATLIPHAVRINVGAARSHADLTRALRSWRTSCAMAIAMSTPASESPAVSERRSTEVAIVGAGVIGLAIAVRLPATDARWS